MKDPRNKLDKFLLEAVKQMFRTVGEKYTEQFVSHKNWYEKKQWSKEQENKFRKWFISHACKKLGWNKKLSEKEYGWFNLMWGWSNKDEKRTARKTV